MFPTTGTSPRGRVVVVAVAYWPGCTGEAVFQVRLSGCPEICTLIDVIGVVPVFVPCIVKLDCAEDRSCCSKSSPLVSKWCFTCLSPEPPVWTAMLVCEQSTVLVVLASQTALPPFRTVAGSRAELTNWSSV